MKWSKSLDQLYVWSACTFACHLFWHYLIDYGLLFYALVVASCWEILVLSNEVNSKFAYPNTFTWSVFTQSLSNYPVIMLQAEVQRLRATSTRCFGWLVLVQIFAVKGRQARSLYAGYYSVRRRVYTPTLCSHRWVHNGEVSHILYIKMMQIR